jgi:ribose transport system permease protein
MNENKLWLRWLNTLGPVLGLIGIYLLFVVIGPPSFSSARNLETIARQTAIVGTAALGMTLVIICGGIDLSVGSIVALSTVIIAYLLKVTGVAPAFAGLGGVCIGAVCGAVIGLLVTRLKVVPFIVTLGMMLLVRGAAKGLASEQKIDAPLSWLNNLLATLPPDRGWMIVSPGVWMTIILAVLAADC